MGVILGVLLLIVVGVPIIIGGIVWAARSLGAGPPLPRELAPTATEFRNHQRMARWIERQLQDDMVRVTISQDDQSAARALLAEYYDEREA
jgi:hypothetical protein